MAEMTLNFLDLTGLQAYDALSKKHVASEVAKGVKTSLKGAALSEDGKLLLYTELPIEGASAAYELELPKQDLSELMPKFKTATAGNIVVVDEDGKVIKDAGIAAADIAKITDVNTVKATADENKAKLEALTALVGTIPEESEATSIIEYIAEVTAKIIAQGYDDTELRALVNANKEALAVLNGNEEGSVRKTVADEIAKVVAGAPESFDTLKEMSDWISSHTNDASEMNSKILENATAIEALKKYVGTLPEGATATTVVEYIAEALDKADLSKYALATDLTAAVNRIAANEKAIGVINTALAEGGTTYEAIAKAQSTGDSAKASVDNLKAYVGTFVTDEESITTVVQYIDAKVAKVNSDIATRLADAEAKIAANETAISEFKTQYDTDKTAIEAKVAKNTEDIAKNTASIAAIQPIETGDIEALFAIVE